MPKVRKPRRGRGPLPPPGYPGYEPAPPVYPGESKERESKEYETENPPPYDQGPPPSYENAPVVFDQHLRVWRPHHPAYDPPISNDQAGDEIQQLQRQLEQNEQAMTMYSNPPPEFNPVHVRRVLEGLQRDNAWIRAAIQHFRRQRMGGGRVVNAHAKKTGALMRKHRISLAEASRRAAAHSRNAKTKAGGRRTAGVPRGRKRT